jgi:hypothetical protein
LRLGRSTILALLGCACGCQNADPKRPDNVPQAAIFAPGGKVGGWWHYCEFNSSKGEAECSIWNGAGLVLYSGPFLPLDRKPLKADELKLIYNPRWGDDAQFINLQDGRVLVPASDFDELSRFGAWLAGTGPNPHEPH